MIEEQVHTFEKLQAQLESLYQEISILSKKSQKDALSEFKLRFVNKVLDDANSLLGDEYKPFDDFDRFNSDDIPNNGDVTMILGQYLSCMEQLRADNVYSNGPFWYWTLNENKNRDKDDKVFIRTSAPKKIKL